MCAGRMLLNNSFHAGYGWAKVTTACLPPSSDCTPVMRSYPAGSTTPGWLTIWRHRYQKSSAAIGALSVHCASGRIL